MLLAKKAQLFIKSPHSFSKPFYVSQVKLVFLRLNLFALFGSMIFLTETFKPNVSYLNYCFRPLAVLLMSNGLQSRRRLVWHRMELQCHTVSTPGP